MVTIRVNRQERALIERASTRAGKNVSEYLRDLALQAAHETLNGKKAT